MREPEERRRLGNRGHFLSPMFLLQRFTRGAMVRRLGCDGELLLHRISLHAQRAARNGLRRAQAALSALME
jgi:hypothetical protein